MSPLHLGLVVVVVTTLVLATGMPVAFGLGVVAVGVLVAFDGSAALPSSRTRCSAASTTSP